MDFIPDAEKGLEEDHVPLSSKTVQCEGKDENCGRISHGAEKEVDEYVAGELCGIQRKTAKENVFLFITFGYLYCVNMVNKQMQFYKVNNFGTCSSPSL